MIDPSIALHVKPAQLNDPLEQAGRAMNLMAMKEQIQTAPIRRAAAEEQTRAHRLENEQRQTAMDADARFKEAIGRGAKQMELYSIDPKQAAAYAKSHVEQRKAELDNATAKAKLIGGRLASVYYGAPAEQAALFAQARADSVAQGIAAEDEIPQQFDPMWVKAKFLQSLDGEKQLDDHRKQLELDERVANAAPENTKKWMDLILQEGSATKSQEQLDGLRQMFIDRGVPKEMLARSLPAIWSDTAVKQMAERAMSPEQRAADADRDASRVQTADEGQKNRDLTKRGQDLTNQRSIEATAAMRGNQTVGNESKLRDDYKAATKDFPAIRDAYGRIQTAAASAPSGASDIALLYGYMKMLDPGSVVREGEFATAANAGGVPDRISTIYNKLLRGDKLSPEVRKQMVEQAESVYRRSAADNEKVTKQFRDISTRSGVNPDNVVVDYGSTLRPAGEATGKITVTDPQGGVHTFATQAQANAFKQLAGIK